MSKSSRNKRPYEPKTYAKVCKLCNKSCCDRPASVQHDALEHDAGREVHPASEAQWWRECYSCHYLCTCEV